MDHREDDVLLDASGLRVAIVVSEFNSEITDGLLNGARVRLKLAKCTDIDVIRAPGTFELPLLARKAAQSGYDAVVALGAVIESENRPLRAHRTRGRLRAHAIDSGHRSSDRTRRYHGSPGGACRGAVEVRSWQQRGRSRGRSRSGGAGPKGDGVETWSFPECSRWSDRESVYSLAVKVGVSSPPGHRR